MLRPGEQVGVAVSGGPDSVCLLEVLRQLAPSAGVTLSVIHLNHQWRGAASEADAAFVAALAKQYGLPLHDRRAAVGPTEDDARQARLAFFSELRAAGKVDRIATGHTRDDQAETVLFRLLRGASPSGLAGILPVTREGLIRPLLGVSRTEVLAYLREQELTWRVDRSNADPRFARNRIRHHWLPALTRDWNPHLSEQLARTAEIARDEDEYLQQLVPPPMSQGEAVLIPVTPLERALRRRQICWAVDYLGGKQLDFRHVEAMGELFAPALGSGRLQVPGIDVLRSFDWVRFAPLESAGVRNWSLPVTVECPVTFPGGSLELTRTGAAPGTMGGDYFDFYAAGSEMTIRNWRPGDAYSPVGSLKTRFENERIPLWERRNWPILVAGEEILWSKRFGVAERFRVKPGGCACGIRLSDNQLRPLSRFRE